MQDEAKTLDVDELIESQTKRKKDAIRLAENPSDLLSAEGFALYIGKTRRAVADMAREGKLPAFYMADPLKPGAQAELWINRKEWDRYAAQLAESAPEEWHGWKDRISAGKPKRGRRQRQQGAAA